MADISTELVKELREQTGLGLMDIKKALADAGGDKEKALRTLKEKGLAVAVKRADRDAKEGYIQISGDGQKLSMVKVTCETDFVAKNPDFRLLADDLAMQIAAMEPQDVAELLAQPFIKDSSQTVADVIKSAIQKFGERIEIGTWHRLDARA